MTQLELTLRDRAARRRHVPKLAARMIAVLAKTRKWTTRADLMDRHGMTPRQCRLARQHAHGRIIYGNNGYRLLRYATPDEIRGCGNALLSQIQALQDEHAQLMRRSHAALARKGEV